MNFILYCRKSTESEDRQILSIESQENELLRVALKEGFNVVSVVKEAMSAKEPGRPLFGKILKDISAGKADGILCWKIDRLARNPIDAGQIQWLLQKNVIKKIRTFEREYLPKDNVLIMNVELGMANQYIRDLSENIKRGNRAKLERGEWPNRAPFGYKNDKANHCIIVDENKALSVRRIFELYATGLYSLKQVVEIVYQEGFRTNFGKKIFQGFAHRIITNAFYCGVMFRDNLSYKAKHEPLVSKSLFDKVQDVLTGKIHTKTQKYLFPIRGFLKCDSCGCALTAAIKKGHVYYYCTNGKGICSEHKRYLRSEKLDIAVREKLVKCQFDEEFVELAYQAKKEIMASGLENNTAAVENIQKELDFAAQKEARLLDGYLSGLIVKEVYEVKMAEIKRHRTGLEVELERLENNHSDPYRTLERTKEVFLTANNAAFLYDQAKDFEKRELLTKLLWNFSVKDGKIVSEQYKMPYNLLFGGPKIYEFSVMRRVQDLNL